jgi:hypothetical protein
VASPCRESFYILKLNHDREGQTIGSWVDVPIESKDSPDYPYTVMNGVHAGCFHELGRAGIPWFVEEGDVISLLIMNRTAAGQWFDMAFRVASCRHKDCEQQPSIMKACIEGGQK